MSNAVSVVIGFVIDKLPNEPVAKRADVYRALAELATTNAEKRTFLGIAEACDAVQAAHDQLVFDFKRRAK